jgi:hypothetical protein
LADRAPEGSVILRIVRGRLAAGRLPALLEATTSTYMPEAARRPGLLRARVGIRPDGDGHEFVAMTAWEVIQDAVNAYGDLSKPTVFGMVGEVVDLLQADYYEVEQPALRASGHQPSVIRLAAGRIAPGWDAAIQEELRRRVDTLGEEMIEGYVGRRMDAGGSVEVMFASVWVRIPRRVSLEKPMWRDIAGRYDAFDVRTYTAIESILNEAA